MNGKVTYRQQYTRCGKKRCRKCREGEGHGPYWYAYWSENGRTVSRYLGINPPADLTTADVFSAPKKEGAKAEGSQVVSSLRTPLSLLPTGATETAPGALSAPPQRHQPTSNLPVTQQSMEKSGQHPITQKAGAFARSERETGSSEAAPHPLEIGEEGRTRPRQSLPLYTPPGTQPVLRIYLLGQFSIERNIGDEWQMLVNRTWQRRRARALLGCLLSQVGRRMGREQAMEALWPDLDLETASNRLNGAVHELRQILEPGIARPASSKMLRLEHDILILTDASTVWVDADIFETLLNRANATTNPVLLEELLEAAAALYAGDYLPEELYSQWAATRREALRRSWMGMLLELARLRAARNAFTSAIEPLDRLLKADPTHETAVRRLMVLLTQLDRRGEAMRAYQRLADTLKQEFESEPMGETVQLYEELRRGYAPTVGTRAVSEYVQNDIERSAIAPTEEQPPAEEQEQESAPPRSSRIRRHKQSPLIGREREMETLREMLLAIDNLSSQAAEAARPKMRTPERGSQSAHFAMLMGENGIGKTRLAEEISHEARSRGWLVIWTRAYEQESTIPYRPWTDLLRTLLRGLSLDQMTSMLEGKYVSASAFQHVSTAHARLARLSTLLPELAGHQELHQSSSNLTLPEQERLYLWEAVLALLHAICQSQPLLIILDDLHWTDDSSLELLAYLARHQSDERLLWMGTCWEMELAPRSRLHTLLNDLRRELVLVTLPLQPLTSAQIAHLIAHLPQQAVQHIQSQAGGNPLFAEELARFSEITPLESLEGQTVHATASPIDHEARAFLKGSNLPETIAAVLERRLNTLNSECQALLSKAAVLGGSFELRTLLRMTGESGSGEDATLDLLEAALRAGLLTEEVNDNRIVYHFWHPLIVNHLYERLSAARRAQLHRKAAGALIDLYAGDEREIAAAVVHHLHKSGQEKEKLAHYAEIAGNQAHLLFAYPEAFHYYRQAWEARQHLSKTTEQDPFHLADLLECLAECNAVQGNYQESRQQYTQALELRQQHHYTPDAFADQEAYQTWQQEEAQIQALIWREIGRFLRRAGEFRQAHECAAKGRQVLQEASLTTGKAWACLQHLDGGVYWLEGNFDDAERYVQECLEIHQAALHQPQPQEPARREQTTHIHAPSSLLAIRRHIMLNDPLELGWTHETLGVIDISTGRYTEALNHLHTALRMFEEHDLVRGMSLVCSNIGAVHAMRCEYTTASTYFQRALEIVERTGDVFSKALAAGNLGDIAARTGNLQDAQGWITSSLALAEQVLNREHSSWALITLATIQQDLGDMRKALETLRRALQVAHMMKSSVRLSFALVALADWRLTCVLSDQYLRTEPHASTPLASHPRLRASLSACERALALEGIDAETLSLGQIVQARATYLLGDLEKAQQQALRALEETRRREAVYLDVRALCLLAEIQNSRGLTREADSSFAAILQTSKQYGLRLDYARTLYRYGACLLRRDSQAAREQGLAHLGEARDMLQTCRASLDLQWVERMLAEHSPRSN